MLALSLLILTAAPRTDGVYLPSKVVPKVLKGQAGEFDLGHALVFDAKQVSIGFDMEEDTKQWRWSKEAGLEVGGGDDWRQASWTEAKGTITTNLRGEPETFSFVPKTLAQLRALRKNADDRALLPSLRGTWTSGARVLVIAEPSTLDGKPVKLESAGCNHSCLDKETSCVRLDEKTLLLVKGRTLTEVAIEGACGNHTAGVEVVKGGLSFVRK